MWSHTQMPSQKRLCFNPDIVVENATTVAVHHAPRAAQLGQTQKNKAITNHVVVKNTNTANQGVVSIFTKLRAAISNERSIVIQMEPIFVEPKDNNSSPRVYRTPLAIADEQDTHMSFVAAWRGKRDSYPSTSVPSLSSATSSSSSSWFCSDYSEDLQTAHDIIDDMLTPCIDVPAAMDNLWFYGHPDPVRGHSRKGESQQESQERSQIKSGIFGRALGWIVTKAGNVLKEIADEFSQPGDEEAEELRNKRMRLAQYLASL